MNITDIDDKIIKRARQNHLYQEYVHSSPALERILDDYAEVLKLFKGKLEENTDPDKGVMLEGMITRMEAGVKQLTDVVKAADETKVAEEQQAFLECIKDPLSDWLDTGKGATVTENSIFESLPRYWENEFHQDMNLLNVQMPDVLTRVSEYVPQIVTFIERIIANGLAYEAKGSVYFDVANFDKTHHYAKLVPEAFGDTKSLAEGEGDLSVGLATEKRSPNDFALWKASKSGEPWWTSPWGNGRPGWHIECSAMASDICGAKVDIHTGGVDLKFPHHDNELAQSEAHFNSQEWIKYFLHTGHLTIAGCKMSKSLKNFITIRDALAKHTATQLRLAFLLHSWKDTLDYSDNTMEMATQYERFLNEFFLNVKDLIRVDAGSDLGKHFDAWGAVEGELQVKFNAAKEAVHKALCDNIDTRGTLDVIRELVTGCNIYIRDNAKKGVNKLLLRRIGEYVTDLLHIFGAIVGPRGGLGFPLTAGAGGGGGQQDTEALVMPFVKTMADFRGSVREQARQLKAVEILKLCDDLRDEQLPNLGVRLEDKENGPAAIKLMSKEALLKEREQKKAQELEKALEKERKRLEQLALQEAREAQKRINPKEMFLKETDKYSAFDENGLPTLDVEGKEVSKGQVKKLQKLQQAQEKKYNEYLGSLK